MLEVDFVIGALGKRAATVDAVGSWEAIRNDGKLHALTSGGLFGKMTSQSHLVPPLMRINYLGHVLRDDNKLNKLGFLAESTSGKFNIPIIMVIGTSTSAGKTTSGHVIIHELKRKGLKVAAAKFTGAGRYRDILTYADAGADYTFDFVDVGLPSTVYPPGKFRKQIRKLLTQISLSDADILLAELGASPLEPYNGSVAMQLLENNISMTVLCAFDPYAALGIERAFRLRPGLITGPASNTETGLALIKKLLGIKALNLVGRQALPDLQKLLNKRIDIKAMH